MNKKYLYIGMAIIGIAGLGFAFKDKIFKSKTTSDEVDNTNGSDNTPPPSVGADEVVSSAAKKADDNELKVGRQGKNVLFLQSVLKQIVNPKITLDGKFGQQVKDALISKFRWSSVVTGNGAYLSKDDYATMIKEMPSAAYKKAIADYNSLNSMYDHKLKLIK